MTSAANVKEAPIGAQLAATACATFMRQMSPTLAATAMVTYTMRDIQALGAWT